MVSVPFRGGWLVLPGKGTPVHNHPDTKGKQGVSYPAMDLHDKRENMLIPKPYNTSFSRLSRSTFFGVAPTL